MPPKRRKFESTFPAARIKKIMQLDDDVGRVASSVPVVISRAVEIFLHALLTRADQYAGSRNAKTLTVGHLKHCIVKERQWDFLKDLTAKIPDIYAEGDNKDDVSPPKRGRKRQSSPSRGKEVPSSKRKPKAKPAPVPEQEEEEEEESDDSDEDSPSDSGSRVSAVSQASIGHTQTTSSLTTSTSASNQAALEGFYQKQLSKDCSPLSIPALIAASSSGLSRDENNSDDDYD